MAQGQNAERYGREEAPLTYLKKVTHRKKRRENRHVVREALDEMHDDLMRDLDELRSYFSDYD